MVVREAMRRAPRNSLGLPTLLYRADLIDATSAVRGWLPPTKLGTPVGGAAPNQPQPSTPTSATSGSQGSAQAKTTEPEPKPGLKLDLARSREGVGEDASVLPASESVGSPPANPTNPTNPTPKLFEQPGGLDWIMVIHQDALHHAALHLTWDLGYPVLPDGTPIWAQLDYEPLDAYLAFQAYLDQGASGQRHTYRLAESLPTQTKIAKARLSLRAAAEAEAESADPTQSNPEGSGIPLDSPLNANYRSHGFTVIAGGGDPKSAVTATGARAGTSAGDGRRSSSDAQVPVASNPQQFGEDSNQLGSITNGGFLRTTAADPSDLFRVRQLQKEGLGATRQEIQDWYHLYCWHARARAYDLYHLEDASRAREIAAIQIENQHLLDSNRLYAKVMEFIGGRGDGADAHGNARFWKDMTPKALIDLLKLVTGLQRVSVGRQAAAPAEFNIPKLLGSLVDSPAGTNEGASLGDLPALMAALTNPDPTSKRGSQAGTVPSASASGGAVGPNGKPLMSEQDRIERIAKIIDTARARQAGAA